MKYSVIIPVYNAEKWVEKAIRSILVENTDEDFEIIAINDGSQDGSLLLLQQLEKEIPQLRVFDKENSGPSQTRNFGMEKARGKYILFCDSDDGFTPGGVSRAVSLCEKAGADILIFGYYVSRENSSSPYHYKDCSLEKPSDWAEHFTHLYSANMLNQVWGKVFSAKLLQSNKIGFPHILWGEDRLFFFRALQAAEKVSVSSECFYDYVQQKNSLITRFVPEKCEICEEIHYRVTSLAKEKGAFDEEAEKMFSYMYVKSLISGFATLFHSSCGFKYREKRQFLKAALSQKSLKEVKGFPADCGRAFQLLSSVVLSGNITLNFLAAWGIHWISGVLPSLFFKAKHVYNKEK